MVRRYRVGGEEANVTTKSPGDRSSRSFLNSEKAICDVWLSPITAKPAFPGNGAVAEFPWVNSQSFAFAADRTKLGAAWKVKANGEEPLDYLCVQLDGPSFPGAIRAVPFEEDAVAHLVWDRIGERDESLSLRVHRGSRLFRTQ